MNTCAEFAPSVRGRLLRHEHLSAYTSWRVGGPADYVFIPADSDDLAQFLNQLPAEMPVIWLGLGSNVLIRDGGIEGVVIITQGALHDITQIDATHIRAEAGVSCAQLARYSARLGLTGLEFLAGIPGTIGGALSMNAGCYGGETWQRVYQIDSIDRVGRRQIRSASDYQASYRHVARPKDEWFLAGYFELTVGDKAVALEAIRTLLEKRNAAQPTGLPNCGSVFRNPPGDYAARLIEQAGLKGMMLGGAYVSEKHANFIINNGQACAADIEALITHIAQVIQEQQGVHLIREVCIIGKKDDKDGIL